MMRALVAVLLLSALTGCASIVNGNTQVVSVETRLRGEQVPGAQCELENPKGKFFVTTPGTLSISRAYDDLSIRCNKAGYTSGVALIKSSTKAMAFGNVIFGGVIGAAVDMKTGAAYDYPAVITVEMGDLVSAAVPSAATK